MHPSNQTDAAIAPDTFEVIRKRTLDLIASLSVEDCCAQSMPDASPIKWHLAHTTWFFETFILEPFKKDFKPFDPSFKVLFNSYYNTIGLQFSRSQRGLITRPSLADILDYRRAIDQELIRLRDQRQGDNDIESLITLGLHHEQQHQELMLTDIKHLLSINPQQPAYDPSWEESNAPSAAAAKWIAFEGGLETIGADGDGFSFDNERPSHRVFVEAFEMASRLVNQGEYLAFILDGGYERPEYWLSEGWQWRQQSAMNQPLYWREENGTWSRFSLCGRQPLALSAPILHLSYYEADAYARWKEARLPTEAEWEVAIRSAKTPELQEMSAIAWQWTQSSYMPYPGFKVHPSAVGEYNAKFMVNQYVLRGGSLATPKGHSRPTYRNFFPAYTCWQFTGIRLARSLSHFK
jgi:ergothioneine biosynthesis protein EgtB